MTNKPNPFNPNSIVAPALFAGRAAQVWEILGKLTQVREGMPSSFILQGDRGIGKTALAKLVMHLSEEADPNFNSLKFLNSYYVVEKNQTLETVIQASLNLMTDRMPDTLVKRLSDRLGNIFKNGKFTIGAFGGSLEINSNDSSGQAEREMAIKDRAVSALSNIVSGLNEIEEEAKRRDGVLIVLDEIHNLKDLDGAAQILRAISTTLDVNKVGKVSFLIICYPEGIEQFFSGDPSARRHFDIIDLKVMPRLEAKEVLTKGFSKIGLTHDEDVLNKHIDVAGGYPHSIQVIGHNLVEVDTNGIIENDDWSAALTKSAVELSRKEFSEMYDFTGKGTIRESLLNVMALIGRPISKNELRELLDGKNIYTPGNLGRLKKLNAVRPLPDDTLVLHSMLFRGAILLHLYRHQATNKSYDALIKKINSYKEKETKSLGEVEPTLMGEK